MGLLCFLGRKTKIKKLYEETEMDRLSALVIRAQKIAIILATYLSCRRISTYRNNIYVFSGIVRQ